MKTIKFTLLTLTALLAFASIPANAVNNIDNTGTIYCGGDEDDEE